MLKNNLKKITLLSIFTINNNGTKKSNNISEILLSTKKLKNMREENPTIFQRKVKLIREKVKIKKIDYMEKEAIEDINKILKNITYVIDTYKEWMGLININLINLHFKDFFIYIMEKEFQEFIYEVACEEKNVSLIKYIGIRDKIIKQTKDKDFLMKNDLYLNLIFIRIKLILEKINETLIDKNQLKNIEIKILDNIFANKIILIQMPLIYNVLTEINFTNRENNNDYLELIEIIFNNNKIYKNEALIKISDTLKKNNYKNENANCLIEEIKNFTKDENNYRNNI